MPMERTDSLENLFVKPGEPPSAAMIAFRHCGLDIGRRICKNLSMTDVTRIINAISQGETPGSQQLLVAIYKELRQLAASRMALEQPGHSLQATALVHEAWLRLLHSGAPASFENRRHFFAAAGEAMRRILVEQARRRSCLKRGGHLVRVDIDDVDVAAPFPDDELLSLDEAMDQFSSAHPRAAEVVKLCYYAGFTQNEAGDILGISVRTVERQWVFARAWLFKAMENARDSHGE
jgi:RNA polymerase sigma factor (TIGR02999 family)